MSALPTGWVECRLGDFLTLKNGYAFKSNDFVSRTVDTVPVIRISDIAKKTVTILNSAHIAKSAGITGFEIKEGDLLIAMSGATTGKAGIYTSKELAYQNQRVGNIKLRSEENGSLKFRNHLIFGLSEKILEDAYGGAQPNISGKSIEEIPVSLPPLSEQKRIADKLDTVLARVDACRERLNRVPLILKRFKQSVLAAATSGKLTEDWREQREGIGASVKYWKSSTIGEVVQAIEAGLNIKCDERPPEQHEIGLVKISAVTWGKFNNEESKTLPKTIELPAKLRINVGDFLISRANTLELVGACVIVDKVTRPLFLSDKVLRLKLPDYLKPWVLYILRSDTGRQQIEALSNGNQLSMRNLSQVNLKSIKVPLPKAEEIIEIVRRVETLFAFADRLEERLITARNAAERLTPALLAKAFRGELVPQDPNDEPASALLARLSSSRDYKASKAKGAGRKTKTPANSKGGKNV